MRPDQAEFAGRWASRVAQAVAALEQVLGWEAWEEPVLAALLQQEPAWQAAEFVARARAIAAQVKAFRLESAVTLRDLLELAAQEEARARVREEALLELARLGQEIEAEVEPEAPAEAPPVAGAPPDRPPAFARPGAREAALREAALQEQAQARRGLEQGLRRAVTAEEMEALGRRPQDQWARVERQDQWD